MRARGPEREREVEKEERANIHSIRGHMAKKRESFRREQRGERGSKITSGTPAPQLQWLSDGMSSGLGNPGEEGHLERTRSCVEF